MDTSGRAWREMSLPPPMMALPGHPYFITRSRPFRAKNTICLVPFSTCIRQVSPTWRIGAGIKDGQDWVTRPSRPPAHPPSKTTKRATLRCRNACTYSLVRGGPGIPIEPYDALLFHQLHHSRRWRETLDQRERIFRRGLIALMPRGGRDEKGGARLKRQV